MNKLILFAAAYTTFAACNIFIDTSVPETGDASFFEKGQKVSLAVSTGDQTKVSSELNSDGSTIDFKWETGDKIKVTVGTASAEFTLKTGAGTSAATFEGTMPASGSKFDVQYPVTDPDLSLQTYSANPIPKDKMKMTATNCTLAGGFTLTPQSAALRLNLYGTNQTISKIIVKDASFSTYTLTINPAVTLPVTEATAKSFFVVVPAGSYKFSAMIFDNSVIPASICKLIPANARTFIANQVLNMAPKEVKEQQTIDLSTSGTANCYIVSSDGKYKFKAVKGNSSISVGEVKGVKVLWESFGTDTAPKVGELIEADVSFKDDYITFSTNDIFKEGNAVIAAYSDAGCTEGNVLWSWHIWMTDTPSNQVYNNSAGTMMDRNLGAVSAKRGDVGALGLLYQWGRKDPFLGGCKISYEDPFNHLQLATSAGSNWPKAEIADATKGTIAYSVSHPMTFIASDDNDENDQNYMGNYDWYYTGSKSTDNTRWKSSKTIYDPCPQGWRVPDGGDSGIWSKAFGSSSIYYNGPWYDYYMGMDFGSGNGKSKSMQLGSSSSIWYPAAGIIHGLNGLLSSVGLDGYYWSCATYIDTGFPMYHAYFLYFDCSTKSEAAKSVSPSSIYIRSDGRSVRCQSE